MDYLTELYCDKVAWVGFLALNYMPLSMIKEKYLILLLPKDRKPVKQLCEGVYGKLFADKSYIDKTLTDWLAKNNDVKLFTKIRKNMKPKPMQAIDKRSLKRRTLIETVFNELKNSCQIEHSRHRSINGFISNLLGGLVAYCWQANKPTLQDVYIEKNEKIHAMKVY